MMKAAVFEKIGVLNIKEVEKPKIQKADDVIIKVKLCSLCGTDVHILSDPPGYIATPNTILGHELVGTIVEVGEAVTTVKVGDMVVCNPNDYCGTCAYCKNNLPNFCENIQAMGIDVDGGFAEFVRTSEKVVYKVRDDVAPEIAAFAEPLACLLNGTNKIRVQPGESVTVVGAGTIGLMFVQMMKAAGAYPIIVSEPSEIRRKVALECGADYVVNPLEQDLPEIVKEKTKFGSNYTIDVVGNQIATCIDCTRRGGTVLLFGVNTQAMPQVTQSKITQNEIRVQGTWLANATFPKAVEVIESGVLDLSKLITHTLPLSETQKGIDLLRRGEGIEILIDPTK